MLNFSKVLCPRWVERDGAEARVGITRYAADALGDVVFAELPEQGRQVMLFVWMIAPYLLKQYLRFAQSDDLCGLAYEH